MKLPRTQLRIGAEAAPINMGALIAPAQAAEQATGEITHGLASVFSALAEKEKETRNLVFQEQLSNAATQLKIQQNEKGSDYIQRQDSNGLRQFIANDTRTMVQDAASQFSDPDEYQKAHAFLTETANHGSVQLMDGMLNRNVQVGLQYLDAGLKNNAAYVAPDLAGLRHANEQTMKLVQNGQADGLMGEPGAATTREAFLSANSKGWVDNIGGHYDQAYASGDTKQKLAALQGLKSTLSTFQNEKTVPAEFHKSQLDYAQTKLSNLYDRLAYDFERHVGTEQFKAQARVTAQVTALGSKYEKALREGRSEQAAGLLSQLEKAQATLSATNESLPPEQRNMQAQNVLDAYLMPEGRDRAAAILDDAIAPARNAAAVWNGQNVAMDNTEKNVKALDNEMAKHLGPQASVDDLLLASNHVLANTLAVPKTALSAYGQAIKAAGTPDGAARLVGAWDSLMEQNPQGNARMMESDTGKWVARFSGAYKTFLAADMDPAEAAARSVKIANDRKNSELTKIAHAELMQKDNREKFAADVMKTVPFEIASQINQNDFSATEFSQRAARPGSPENLMLNDIYEKAVEHYIGVTHGTGDNAVPDAIKFATADVLRRNHWNGKNFDGFGPFSGLNPQQVTTRKMDITQQMLDGGFLDLSGYPEEGRAATTHEFAERILNNSQPVGSPETGWIFLDPVTGIPVHNKAGKFFRYDPNGKAK